MEIEWRGVSFSYDKPVLKNVTARMDLTQNHIIRGENGAGKSTLIKLLLGMETPQSGEISVLGSATGQLDKTLFPSEIFYLPQKAPVFDLTAGQMLSAVIETEDGTAVPDGTHARGESPSVRSRVTDSERTAIHGESPSARGNEPHCTNALAREHTFAQRLSQLGEDFNEFCEKPLAEMSDCLLYTSSAQCLQSDSVQPGKPFCAALGICRKRDVDRTVSDSGKHGT